MSSTYRVMCLGHTPPIEMYAENVPEMDEILFNREATHPACDLLLLRYSGGLAAVGCPGSIDAQNRSKYCGHFHVDTIWDDADWIRLLYLTSSTTRDSAPEWAKQRVTLQELINKIHTGCWSYRRLHAIRDELL